MVLEEVIKGIKSEYCSPESLKALSFIENKVCGGTYPLSYWVKDEDDGFGEEGGALILNALESLSEKVGDRNITLKECHALFTHNVSKKELQGWEDKKVSWGEHECLCLDIEPYLPESDISIADIEREIIDILSEISIRKETEEKAKLVSRKAGIDAVFIADPLGAKPLNQCNSNTIGSSKWNGSKEIRDGFAFTGYLDIFHPNLAKYIEKDGFVFLNSERDTWYCVESDYKELLTVNNSCLVFLESDSNHDDDFLEWYDDIYGGSLFASPEQLNAALKEYQKND